jgi:hypothetical protein
MTSVDSAQVRAEGGSFAPALVVPLGVELDPRPDEERLALLRLEVALWIGSPRGTTQLGAPAIAFGDGAGSGIWQTYTTHVFTTRVELRFPLSLEMVRLIEDTAHAMTTPNLALTLKIKPAVAHVVDVAQLTSEQAIPGQKHIVGSAFELRPIPWPTVDQLEVHLSREQWAEIARGFGLADLRTIVVRLPRHVEGLDAKVVALFDEAIAKYETRDYRGAIGLCRDIRDLVHTSLGATNNNRVEDVIAAERGLDRSSPPIQFIADAWKVLVDTTNNARHAQSVGVYSAADGRAVLTLTALLLEYLGDSLRRRI